MHRILSALIVLLSLTAAPALAAPCKTQGSADAPIAFPRGDASDVHFARAMVEVMLDVTTDKLPRALGCMRTTVRTALGDYTIGGEDEDAFPRIAMRADGKKGPVAYLAPSLRNPEYFALAVYQQGGATVVKRFYSGIPNDQRLAADLRDALADDGGIMAYVTAQKLVRYGFSPTDGIPPPVESGDQGGRVNIKAGPQFMILDSGDPAFLDPQKHMQHRPSGFTCVQSFDGLPVLLMSIEPNRDSLICNYRAGTELRFDANDPVRYSMMLVRRRSGQTTRQAFDQLASAGRAALRIRGDHTPPLATGPAPAPEFVVFWDTEDDGVQGIWFGKVKDWMIAVRAQYPPGAANDSEARIVAKALFEQASKQLR